MDAKRIRTDKIDSVLAGKLDQATTHLHEVREVDRPCFSRYNDQRVYVTNFIMAARGVFATLETFAQERMRPVEFFRWVGGWERALNDAHRELWASFADDRRAQEHGEGAALNDVLIEITEGGGIHQQLCCGIRRLGHSL
jgi:hypothetical protein